MRARRAEVMSAEHPMWVEQEDYHYAHPDPPHRKLRTRASYDGEAMRWTTVHKSVVESVLLRTQIMDVRVALARETPVEQPVALVETTHVRIKQRRTFRAGRTPFAFDCSFGGAGRRGRRRRRRR